MSLRDQCAGNAAAEAGDSPSAAASGSASMGELVTPHAPVTEGPGDFRFLACGIDSLDLGLYVDWPEWNDLFDRLFVAKESAKGNDGSIWRHPIAGEFLVYPGGASKSYFFHLQQPHYHIFLAARAESGVVDGQKRAATPNVYISIGAQKLWTHGPVKCAAKCKQIIEEIGGEVQRAQVSRCDLAADFWIDGGLTLDFLRNARVSLSRKTSHNMDDDRLESYYLGKRSSPVQLRIYDKTKQIANDPDKLFILDVWKTPRPPVWRIEFQIRRTRLREWKVNTLDDLQRSVGGIWKHLTAEWASFRLDDNVNTTRRTVHPWWQHVQNCADLFGPVMELERAVSTNGAPPDWCISHVAGCLVSYAALTGKPAIDGAIVDLANAVEDYWLQRDWAIRLSEGRYLRSMQVRGTTLRGHRADQSESRRHIRRTSFPRGGPVAWPRATWLAQTES